MISTFLAEYTLLIPLPTLRAAVLALDSTIHLTTYIFLFQSYVVQITFLLILVRYNIDQLFVLTSVVKPSQNSISSLKKKKLEPVKHHL